ncbi:RpiB/LacA/LacB family sugar-phosphate isomerase [Paucilactobacillus sp. N302-9]
MKVGIGADVNGFDMKETVKAYLETLGYEMVDYGIHEKNETHYPEIAAMVANAIKNQDVERGILICGTGIGMAIAANKVKGIRAAQAHDVYSAQRAELSNNAQIITMGGKVIGMEAAKVIAKEYLAQTFTTAGHGKSSAQKVDEIMAIENGTC